MGLSGPTFEMRGVTRLAGARPLDCRVRPRVQAQPQDKFVLSLGEIQTRRRSPQGSVLCSTSRQLDPAKRRQTSCVHDLPGQTWRAMAVQTDQQLEYRCRCYFDPYLTLLVNVLRCSADPDLLLDLSMTLKSFAHDAIDDTGDQVVGKRPR